MYKVLTILLVFCLLLGGCVKEDDPMPTPPAQTTVPPESSIPPETTLSPDYNPVIGNFVIEDDTIYVSGTQLQMVGISSNDSATIDKKEQYTASETALGIFTHSGTITLSFSEDIPRKIVCYVDDYGGTAPPRIQEYTVDKPTAETSLHIDHIELYPSSSTLPHDKRQLRIVCQYPDRTIEYFLVLNGILNLPSA